MRFCFSVAEVFHIEAVCPVSVVCLACTVQLPRCLKHHLICFSQRKNWAISHWNPDFWTLLNNGHLPCDNPRAHTLPRSSAAECFPICYHPHPAEFLVNELKSMKCFLKTIKSFFTSNVKPKNRWEELAACYKSWRKNLPSLICKL